MSAINRPPIVTILGHVDHGKTTLLDFIRKSSVAAKEHGGITQHIGAYQVEIPKESKSRESEANRGILRLPSVAQDDFTENRKITFIDTPGHAAFEKMRSRGANVADIAILVVAIDDGVMPQTIEAIKHIQGAKVPMIVAVNKIDLPGIDKNISLQKLKKQLSDQNISLEEYGGDVPIVPLSAKTGEGVDKLLEMILLVAEMHEIKGDPSQSPTGVVIESNIDKFKGPIATILIKNGTLKKNDQIMIGGIKGKIRGMFDSSGKSLDAAGPSTPVEVLGLESVPQVGAVLGELAEVKEAEAIQSLVDKLKQGEAKTLKVVIKADKQGSLEAIEQSLGKMNEERKVIDFIYTGTGDIGEENIKLASTVGAIVIGFNVKVASTAQKHADTEHVLIRTYNIIYELLEDVEEVVQTLLEVGQLEEVLGKANIIAEFPHGKNEKIAGCRMIEGIIAKGQKIRIMRDGASIGEVKLKSLKKVKDEVNKVEKGNDCGMLFDPIVDFQIGDVVESFRVI
ncbi:GTP-binding protein [Candidatus Daviesbacteria bacterium]|nr:GTP-binding protein [Candidatus Daviesbacteria bacterium]